MNGKMMAINKKFLIVMIAFTMLFSTVFAGPIVIKDLKVENKRGEYVALVTLENTNGNNLVVEKLYATIDEINKKEDLGVFEVSNGTKTFQINLNTLDSYSQLKKGEEYTLTISSGVQSGASVETSLNDMFLYGKTSDSEGLDLIVEKVEVNDDELLDGESLQVLNGETIEIDLRFSALSSNVEDARFRAYIEGYEHDSENPIMTSTEIFDLKAGKTYTKKMVLRLPSDMDSQADYKLRITGANSLSGLTYKEYKLYVDTKRHRLDIISIITTPNNGVEPGEPLIASVRFENRGQKAQDSVKVSIAVPELGLEEYDYVGNIDPDEAKTSSDLFFTIPEDVKAGQYEVVATLSYNDEYEKTVEKSTITIMSPNVEEEKNLLVSFSNNVELVGGEQNTFQVVVANPNQVSKPISITPVDVVWADVEVTPSLKMVSGGDSAEYVVKVTPKDSIAGEKSLSLLVKDGGESTNEITVSAYVKADNINWVNIALGVLLVIAIVILLSLVVTIARKKNNDENNDENSSTEEYY